MGKKIFIKNRNGLKLCVVVDKAKNDKGLIFIEHGLTGTKDQPHIQKIKKVFKKHNFTTVTFDASNAIGESDGKVEDVTFTAHYHDLEDVINWAKDQTWYDEPFILSGHSLGAFSSILYAENYPDKVKALVPISPVTSGKNLEIAKRETDENRFEDWKEKGYFEKISSFNGKHYKVPFSLQEDLYNYDVYDKIENIQAPVFLLTGDHDRSTPLYQVKHLFDELKGRKELIVLRDCPHSMYEKNNLDALERALEDVISFL